MSPRLADAVDRWTPWAYIALVFVAALALAFLFWQTQRLNEETRQLSAENQVRIMDNRERITDIQQSRERLLEVEQKRLKAERKAEVASCRQTYEGVREVFLPFFPPKPRTAEQQANLDKFNRTVDQLKAECATQTQIVPG